MGYYDVADGLAPAGLTLAWSSTAWLVGAKVELAVGVVEPVQDELFAVQWIRTDLVLPR